MTGDLTSQLQQAAASTFEQLGFLFADADLTEEQEGLEPEAVARVRFTGPLDGTLEVRLAGGLLPVLAANMLGADTPPEKSVVLDAFGEVSNVICGNVLPLIGGAAAVFDLAAPEVVGGAGEDLRPLDPVAVSLRMGLEGGRADLALTFTERPAT